MKYFKFDQKRVSTTGDYGVCLNLCLHNLEPFGLLLGGAREIFSSIIQFSLCRTSKKLQLEFKIAIKRFKNQMDPIQGTYKRAQKKLAVIWIVRLFKRVSLII